MTTTVWLTPGVKQAFHIQIRKKDDGWYIRCPEHHGHVGTGPYAQWETALNLTNLHLSNYNHF